ncbi:MAG TPA: hypothetical protein VN893_14835 [Bryobacteraceae bacterium]|nr:hypothetical protein [Bryobacteraceae bacterium]
MSRTIGFSTGALAYADFRRALRMLHSRAVAAVELSALRQPELQPLMESLDALDLSQFTYIAVHAPSRVEPAAEPEVVRSLLRVAERGWPVVLHPDAVHDYALWRQLGAALCVENMDRRKPHGRTAGELESVFERLPQASLCFDIGHARQVDSTMTEAYFILRTFGNRLRQVHVSEVNTRSTHDPLSFTSVLAFRQVAELIPENVPLILETPVCEGQIESEMAIVREALPLLAYA